MFPDLARIIYAAEYEAREICGEISDPKMQEICLTWDQLPIDVHELASILIIR